MIKTLYGLDKKGGFKVWDIEVKGGLNGDAYLVINHGKEGGKQTEKSDYFGHGSGKQGRSAFEQAVLEAQARIKKQIDKNYREDKADLETLDVLAMLAADYRKQGHRIKFPCYGSVKYDGVRALAKKREGVVTLESRTSQPYDVPHILEALTVHMRDGDIWDGEIYFHGIELQNIVSAVKRTDTQGEIDKCRRKLEKLCGGDQDAFVEAQAEMAEAVIIHDLRPKLEFHIFDVHSDAKFIDRLTALDELTGIPVVSPCIQVTQYLWVADADDMKVKHDQAINEGYEGLMLRNHDGLYESGKRSADLQKYKEFLDSEFEILDVVPDGEDGSRFVVRNDLNERTFCVVMGSMAERAEFLKNKELYIGKMLTVRYQSRYKGTLLPQFPTGVAIRDYE